MDLEKIRSMSDIELTNYLKSISSKKSMNCYKCGKNGNYTLNIKNGRASQQKKLCTLCDGCYKKLLEYLNITDIIWED